jgi:hypothetical protein
MAKERSGGMMNAEIDRRVDQAITLGELMMARKEWKQWQ